MTVYDTNSEHFKAILRVAATSGDRLKKKEGGAAPSPQAIAETAEKQ